jgi:hypothetical protein
MQHKGNVYTFGKESLKMHIKSTLFTQQRFVASTDNKISDFVLLRHDGGSAFEGKLNSKGLRDESERFFQTFKWPNFKISSSTHKNIAKSFPIHNICMQFRCEQQSARQPNPFK